MAFNTHLPVALFLSFLFVQAALARIECEHLSVDFCAFSIASSGKRCLLETKHTVNGELEHQCLTSEIMVEKMAGYIETDRCIEACGLDRCTVGIASDALRDPDFEAKLRSPACFNTCPNVVDLYFNMAAGEGFSLENNHGSIAKLMSSAPAPSPSLTSFNGVDII